MKDLGERLKELMAERSISAYAIGRQGGPTEATITDIIKGKTKNPGVFTLQIIAGFLGMTVSEIIGEKEPPPPVTRSPSWKGVRAEMISLGVDEESADVALRMLQPLAQSEYKQRIGRSDFRQKDQGRKKATG